MPYSACSRCILLSPESILNRGYGKSCYQHSQAKEIFLSSSISTCHFPTTWVGGEKYDLSLTEPAHYTDSLSGHSWKKCERQPSFLPPRQHTRALSSAQHHCSLSRNGLNFGVNQSRLFFFCTSHLRSRNTVFHMERQQDRTDRSKERKKKK